MLTWHIITGEYPPVIGGVSGYSELVAHGLADAGDEVHVWCPPLPAGTANDGVTIHQDLGQISRHDLRTVDQRLDRFPRPRRLLVQWVPHGFGYRSMNVGFCLWLWRRARRGDRVEIVLHDRYLAFGEGGFRWTAVATVHRLMTVVLTQAASRIWIAIPDWERRWRPYALGRDLPFTWLPVPSSLPIPLAEDVHRVRDRFAPDGGSIVGYLGSYGSVATHILFTAVPEILERTPGSTALLLGQNGSHLHRQLTAAHPGLAPRIHASGTLTPAALAEHVASCDLLVQPYPDGISSRRTSAMAGLALGIPVVTTTGHLTEPLWAETGCVALARLEEPRSLAAEAIRLLADSGARTQLADRGRVVYRRQFDVSHTISALRRAAEEPCESRS